MSFPLRLLYPRSASSSARPPMRQCGSCMTALSSPPTVKYLAPATLPSLADTGPSCFLSVTAGLSYQTPAAGEATAEVLAAVTWDCWTCGFAFGPDKSESLCSHKGLRPLAVDLVSFGECLSEGSVSILKSSQSCLLLQPSCIQGFKHANSTFPARLSPRRLDGLEIW